MKHICTGWYWGQKLSKIRKRFEYLYNKEEYTKCWQWWLLTHFQRLLIFQISNQILRRIFSVIMCSNFIMYFILRCPLWDPSELKVPCLCFNRELRRSFHPNWAMNVLYLLQWVFYFFQCSCYIFAISFSR